MFDPKKLLYVKSVKRNGGTEWAYYDKKMKDEFTLNFSERQLGSVEKLKEGDIILLFQRVDKIYGIPSRTYLTHLVTILDNDRPKKEELEHKYKWTKKVKLNKRANPKEAIYTAANNLRFDKVRWGTVCDISLLSETKSKGQIQKEIQRLFDIA